MKHHMFLQHILDKKYRDVAEVGVFTGTLTKRIVSNKNSLIENYYCIDPWKPYIEEYDRVPREEEYSQSWWDGIAEKVYAIQNDYPIIKIVRLNSLSAGLYFRNNAMSLDAVYIDAVHDRTNMIIDLWSWLPVIRDGGMISGHDYTKNYEEMVKIIDIVFGKDLNVLLINPEKSAMSYKNADQGGNWWVWINNLNKYKYIKRLEDTFGDSLDCSLNKLKGQQQ